MFIHAAIYYTLNPEYFLRMGNGEGKTHMKTTENKCTEQGEVNSS